MTHLDMSLMENLIIRLVMEISIQVNCFLLSYYCIVISMFTLIIFYLRLK